MSVLFFYSKTKEKIKNGKEGELFTFQNDGDIFSPDSKWLEGQMYALAYDTDDKDTVDFAKMEGEVSKSFKVDSTEMQPVGKKFRRILEE